MTGLFDWICLSPKKMKPALEEIKPLANEFKVIINNKRDLIWADAQRKQLKLDCKLYLQPEWSKKDIITPMIIEFVQENKYWTISLQTHKYMDIP